MNALPVDISDITNQTDFLRVVEEMNRTHIPRALKRKNKTIAMLIPPTATEEQTNAQSVLAFAGSLKGIDAEQFKKDLYNQSAHKF